MEWNVREWDSMLKFIFYCIMFSLKHLTIKWQNGSKRKRITNRWKQCYLWVRTSARKCRKYYVFLLTVTMTTLGLLSRVESNSMERKTEKKKIFLWWPENKKTKQKVFWHCLTKHWSQLRPVTRRLQKQSPLTGSHWELPDTVPLWSHRQAGGTKSRAKLMVSHILYR